MSSKTKFNSNTLPILQKGRDVFESLVLQTGDFLYLLIQYVYIILS